MNLNNCIAFCRRGNTLYHNPVVSVEFNTVGVWSPNPYKLGVLTNADGMIFFCQASGFDITWLWKHLAPTQPFLFPVYH